MVKCNDTKLVLRIGRYHHAMGDGFAEFPLRLERNLNGFAYWATARGGEYRWWLLVKCTDEAKSSVLAPI